MKELVGKRIQRVLLSPDSRVRNPEPFTARVLMLGSCSMGVMGATLESALTCLVASLEMRERVVA